MTNEEGQRLICELLANRDNPIFNDFERRFIAQIAGAKWERLSRHEGLVVHRLIGWLRGAAVNDPSTRKVVD